MSPRTKRLIASEASRRWRRATPLACALLAAARLLCGCASTGAPAQRPATDANDENLARCRDMMAALASDSAEAAEKSFSARMHAELPPLLLRSQWHALQGKYGALASWRVTQRDALGAMDRLTLELQFADRIMYQRVVFGRGHEVVGLWFSAPPAQRAVPEAPATTRQPKEIEITVGPLALRGSLVLPRSVTPVPGVVLVAGSGPSDRDETVLGAKPFRDLALGLAARGIGSLRFDKRPFVHPELFKGNGGTVEAETIEDAIAAVALLRARPEVDARRLVVLGHSLGALLAPEIASRAGGVAALVLLGAPARPIPELILEQLRNAGAKPGELNALDAKVRALPNLPPSELVMGTPASYWQDLAKRDEFGVARTLGRPVLLLRGAEDHNVAAVDQERWVQELAGHVPVENATIPRLNHLFTPAGSPSQTEQHVPDELIERVAAFIRSLKGI